MARKRVTWKDRACGYETPRERFLRHNEIVPSRRGLPARRRRRKDRENDFPIK